MNKISIVFFGTHDFATVILQGLTDSPLFDIKKVITQPDRPVGRKKIMTPPPVKILAEENNLKLEQPNSLKNYNLEPNTYDLAIVAQYGLLIPLSIIETPQYHTINVHTSLLPKYRGASPIQSAILNGDKTTGITIMLMDKGMDSGPILAQKEIDILPDETYLELDSRMAQLGSELLLDTIPKYVEKTIEPHSQDETKVTLCSKLSREDGQIDWDKTTEKIYNQYRAMTPWPGIWSLWNEKRLKLLKIKPASENINPGEVKIIENHIFIGTKNTSIEVLELQLEGKPAMDNKTFSNGYQNIAGEILK